MGAEYLTSPLLSQEGFVHAFFTRRGGVSLGPYASLNFSRGVGDDAASVAENLERAASALGLPAEHLCVPSQVHGDLWLELGPSETPDGLRAQQADALISTRPEFACCVQTADCVPILIGDPESGRVAAIHAGWRGTVLNIAGKIAAHLLSRSTWGELRVAIGPHISADAFEVSDDVARALASASPAGQTVVQRSRAKPHVDLRRIIRSQLESVGIAPSCIDDVMGCTVSQEQCFFSYRRDGQRSGRHLSAIRPLPMP